MARIPMIGEKDSNMRRMLSCAVMGIMLLSACSGDLDEPHREGVGGACDSRESCRDGLYCEAGRCVDPAQQETAPSCGSNSRHYEYEEEAWPSGDFCEQGSLIDENVVFPEPGGEVVWWCQEENGELALRCVAERDGGAVSDPVDGVCGENSGVFEHDENDWPSTQFCLKGVYEGDSLPFPGQGEEVSWQCLGLDGGEDASCSARRAEAPVEPVDGVCGENARDFMREEVDWPGEVFCLHGELQGNEPAFPALGEHVSWSCLGQDSGNDVSCRADRLRICSPERSEPEGWVRKTAECGYSTASGWVPSCLAWMDIWPGPFFQVGGVTYRLFVDSEVDNYIALEFDTMGMQAHAEGSLNSAPPGGSLGHYRTRIVTISRCPGDFHQEAIEAETGCYFHLTGVSPNLSWGGPDTGIGCRLHPDEVYYLNIIHTGDTPGTHPNHLSSNCDDWRCGAVYAPHRD